MRNASSHPTAQRRQRNGGHRGGGDDGYDYDGTQPATVLSDCSSGARRRHATVLCAATGMRRQYAAQCLKSAQNVQKVFCSSWHSKTLVGNHFEDFEL